MNYQDVKTFEHSRIISEEQQLFDEWREFHGEDQFVSDGIVDMDAYIESPFKVLFAFKEVNDAPSNYLDEKRSDWAMPASLRVGAISPTKRYPEGCAWPYWEVVARWSCGIFCPDAYKTWDEIRDGINAEPNSRKEWLRRVAIVNLKKSGGSATASVGFRDYVRKCKHFIRKQLLLYEPDLIVCGGTYDAVTLDVFAHEVIDHKRTSRGVRWCTLKERPCDIVDFAHFGYFPHLSPSVKPSMHYGLVDAVGEIRAYRTQL